MVFMALCFEAQIRACVFKLYVNCKALVIGRDCSTQANDIFSQTCWNSWEGLTPAQLYLIIIYNPQHCGGR